MSKASDPRTKWRGWLLGAAITAVASPAGAQVLGGLGRGVLPSPAPVGGLVSAIGTAGDQALTGVRDVAAAPLSLRRDALRALVRANPGALEVDDKGEPVVRGEVLALSPTPEAIARAQAAGFLVARRSRLDALDLDLVVLQAPPGVPARAAVARLRALDPQGRYDFDHIYSGAGGTDSGTNGSPPSPAGSAGRVRVGLLDTGIARDHPAFAGSTVEQRGFAPGGIKVAAHGTAVASLMVGQAGRFRGAAPAAALYAADVYGDGPTGGSAEVIARALAWMAGNRVPVINVSLVGPPDLTLQAAVQAVQARGEAIVAPVGNDGPAAPPLYPGSYPGVIAVTAVDARGKVLFEAGRGRHLDFAAPGADIFAASPGGGFAAVRGTSFAAPIVAARLALLMPEPGREALARAETTLARQADRSGGAYGRGLVGQDLRASLR